jgi:hypothetical protein
MWVIERLPGWVPQGQIKAEKYALFGEHRTFSLDTIKETRRRFSYRF